MCKNLSDRFDDTPSIKGTRSYHHYIPSSCCLHAYTVSGNDSAPDIFHMLKAPCLRSQNCVETVRYSFKIGDWVLVNYFDEQYPGTITDIADDSLCVSCLEKSGSFFKYPSQPDIHWYPCCDIIAVLEEPELKKL